jgi:hypothetical protein
VHTELAPEEDLAMQVSFPQEPFPHHQHLYRYYDSNPMGAAILCPHYYRPATVAARSMQCSNNSTINHLLQPQTKTATAFFICHHGHDMTRQQTTINNRKNIMKLI